MIEFNIGGIADIEDMVYLKINEEGEKIWTDLKPYCIADPQGNTLTFTQIHLQTLQMQYQLTQKANGFRRKSYRQSEKQPSKILNHRTDRGIRHRTL